MSKIANISWILILFLIFSSCDQADDLNENKDENKAGKPEITTFKFASSNIDCGAYTQNKNSTMVHINTEKCHDEIYRPTLTLYFGNDNPIAPGTYSISESQTPEAGMVYITASDFMNPVMQPQILWLAISGSIEIVSNASDSSKLDIELQTIEMQNTSFESTTDIPEFDTLSGYIIGI